MFYIRSDHRIARGLSAVARQDLPGASDTRSKSIDDGSSGVMEIVVQASKAAGVAAFAGI